MVARDANGGESIPDDLVDFLSRYVDSVTELEALLLLRRDPAERWDAPKAAARLYTTEQEAATVLARLQQRAFLAYEGGAFWFDCKDAELEGRVSRLAELYRTHLIPITKLIHAKPQRIREFADAFRFRQGSS
jgi:hypothetical protein